MALCLEDRVLIHPSNHSSVRVLPLRRLALMATTIAGLSAGGLLVAPAITPYAPYALAQDLSQEAQHVARPVGFADIVEKVKPAVISVRVKMRTTSTSSDGDLPFPKGSPLEKFFKRFGMPEGMPNMQRGQRFGTAQGSGFFISADGY